MAHGVAQLHAALVTALTGLSTTGAHVFDDETTAIADASLPALRVLDDGRETVDYITQSPPRKQERAVEFRVIGLAKAANAKATLNAIAAEVEAALYANRTLGGLARDARIVGIDKSYSDAAEVRVGSSEISIVVDWVAAEGSPATPL